MANIKYGDVVKVSGYENGRQATIIDVKSEDQILVQMGPKTLLVSSDMITVTGHALQDRDGNVVDVNLEVGDKIRYTYPNPPADPEEEQPVRYGEIVDFISEKRVSVRWFGTDEEKAERISRIKWVPMIPAWYVKNNGGN